MIWYRIVQVSVSTLLIASGGLRASGRGNIPRSGAGLVVSNHMSHLDVFILGIALERPLNYVARSTLFFPPLGALIRSVGGFPIQREGMGSQGLKETLRRLRAGGLVLLFPEGTRSRDGEVGEFKQGIAVLAARAKVPVIPAGLAGTFQAWPRTRPFPLPHALRVHYGAPITPEELASLDAATVTQMLRERVLDCQREARRGLAHDLGQELAEIPVGQFREMG
jgi:1-acyl-sn-glycerol-3-phosphate acyltransferase